MAAPQTVVVTRSPWYLARFLFFLAALAFLFAGLAFTGTKVITSSGPAWIAYGLALFAAAWAVP